MDQWMLAATLAHAAKRLAIGLEVAGCGPIQLPFFHSLLLLTMCSCLACLSFTMVHRPSSLIIVTKIWCLSSVGVGISKEALDRARPH